MISNGEKKVLVLTSIYPADDVRKEWTPVVHYFVREWVKSGVEVRVVNYVSRFPKLAYWAARLFKEIISSKEGFAIGVSPLKEREYVLDGVNVARFPLRKFRPHGCFSEREISKAVKKTKAYCLDNGFRPDVIVSHWSNPQLAVMAELKAYYGCRTVYVAHDDFHFEFFGKNEDTYLQAVDKIGFRSAGIKRNFETEPRYIKPSFMCYSGIPSEYVDAGRKKFFREISRFVFVGNLIGRKYPSEIIEALATSFKGGSFSMVYIGAGNESEKVRDTAVRLNVEGSVHLLGRQKRERVIRCLDESDVFVMISRDETFGLVYLEAMSRGCIVIASRNEGFDGIIRDGENGFLCEAGNSHELAAIITRIRKMPLETIQRISDAAIRTASGLTDEKAAACYLSEIME
jgi:glycosyltransferase involved in cell wall biosynthesis